MVSQNHGGGERGEGKAGEKRKKKKKKFAGLWLTINSKLSNVSVPQSRLISLNDI